MNDKDFLLAILSENNALQSLLSRLCTLDFPHLYIGAGCVAQSVWNYYHGYALDEHIKDYDVVYFDEDLSFEKEKECQTKIKELCADLAIDIDVINQARVHLWYENYFGNAIKPYQSIEDAIGTWPTTATAVAFNCLQFNEIISPFGLTDLLTLVVRANKRQITKEIYDKKIERWTKLWPQLRVVPWDNEF